LAAEECGQERRPVPIRLCPKGKAAWIAFFNDHAEQQEERIGDLAAAWSKLEGYCGRLALILHCCRQAAGELREAAEIDAASVNDAAQLVRWFGREAERVYGTLAGSEADAERRRVVELIQARGGTITVRDLQRASRKYATAEAAASMLAELVKAGLLVEEERPAPGTGGWQGTVYRVRGR
jgi:CRISPR-associated protein Cmr3